MPTYTARCKACEHIQDYYEKIDNCYNTPPCEQCGNLTKKILTPSSVHVFKPYLDENISDRPVWVETKKQKKALLKKNGLREKCDYFS